MKTKQELFEESIINNNIEVFFSLLNDNDIDVNGGDFWCPWNAAGYGYIEIFESLINHPDIDLSEDNSCWLFAVEMNQIDILKLILEKYSVDFSHDNNWAIRYAYAKKMENMILFLWHFKNVRKKLKIHDNKIYQELNKKYMTKKLNEF